jgi:hypothetical protein
VEVATGKLFLIECFKLTKANCLCAKLVTLCVGAVYPDNLFGAEKLFHFFEPFEYGRVLSHFSFSLIKGIWYHEKDS